MKQVRAVYGLIYHEEKDAVLMVLNKDNNEWTLPGGEVEEEESLEEGLNREVEEETGYLVRQRGMVSINEKYMHQIDAQVIFFTFRATIIGGSETIKFPHEIGKIKWVAIEEANKLMPYHPQGIRKLLEYTIDYRSE